MGQFEFGKAFLKSCNKLQSLPRVGRAKPIAFNKPLLAFPLLIVSWIGWAELALRSEPLSLAPTASQATLDLASEVDHENREI